MQHAMVQTLKHSNKHLFTGAYMVQNSKLDKSALLSLYCAEPALLTGQHSIIW